MLQRAVPTIIFRLQIDNRQMKQSTHSESRPVTFRLISHQVSPVYRLIIVNRRDLYRLGGRFIRISARKSTNALVLESRPVDRGSCVRNLENSRPN